MAASIAIVAWLRAGSGRLRAVSVASLAALALVAAPAAAQSVEAIDPNSAVDADLDRPVENPGADPAFDSYSEAPAPAPAPAAGAPTAPTYGGPRFDETATADGAATAPAEASVAGAPSAEAAAATAAETGSTYRRDDLIGAAEGLFGKGAEGLAKMIESALANQGEPNAYIVGREAGGAFVVGARYGSGTLFHKVEGQQPVYWTGPSVGFDAGAQAGNVFVLVYNLYDTEDLYERFPAGEGQLYVIGGLSASYVRKGNVLLIPIRMGAGLRLGVNAGYMRFSHKQRWLPF